MSKFEAGQDVICINNQACEEYLAQGERYTIVDIRDDDRLSLAGIERRDGFAIFWYEHRFILAPPLPDWTSNELWECPL